MMISLQIYLQLDLFHQFEEIYIYAKTSPSILPLPSVLSLGIQRLVHNIPHISCALFCMFTNSFLLCINLFSIDLDSRFLILSSARPKGLLYQSLIFLLHLLIFIDSSSGRFFVCFVLSLFCFVFIYGSLYLVTPVSGLVVSPLLLFVFFLGFRF